MNLEMFIRGYLVENSPDSSPEEIKEISKQARETLHSIESKYGSVRYSTIIHLLNEFIYASTINNLIELAKTKGEDES